MKKLSLILVAVMLCMSFAACGGNKAPEATPAPSPVPYNEDDITVTLGDEITTDPFGTPQIPIVITNSGTYDYGVTVESITINGISEVETSDGIQSLTEGSVVYETVPAGESVETTIMFLAGIWKKVGLSAEEITSVTANFKVEDEFHYKNYTKTITKEY